MWIQNIPSPLGELHATWSESGLFAVSFKGDNGCEFDFSELPRSIRTGFRVLEETLTEYFENGTLSWSLDKMDWAGVSHFHCTVLRLCHEIPAGETLTYGELAKLAGSPLAARAVGGAMARNRWPLIIPCHRVVGTKGKLTGYSGEGGTKTKHWLLEHEFHAARGQLFLNPSR